MDDREQLKSEFILLSEQRQLSTFFSRLTTRLPEVSESKLMSCFIVISALMDEWNLNGQESKLYETHNALSFVEKSLVAVPEMDKRVVLIKKLFNSTKSIYFLTDFVFHIKISIDNRYSRPEPCIDEKSFTEIVSLAEDKILIVVNNPKFQKFSKWRDVLYHWAAFAPESARLWFLEWIENPQNLLRYLKSLLPDMNEEHAEIFYPSQPVEIARRINDYLDFAPVADLDSAIRAVDSNKLSAEDAQVLEWGKQAVALMLKGNKPTIEDSSDASTEDNL